MTTSDPVACPYLGSVDDPRSRFLFATPAHRCYAKRRPALVEIGHQGRFCLSPDFPTCPRYRAPASVEPATSAGLPTEPVPGDPAPRSPVPDILRPVSAADPRTQLAPAQEHPPTDPRPSFRRRRIVLLILIVAALLLWAIVGSPLGPLPGFDLPALGVFAAHRQITLRGSQVRIRVLYAVGRHGVFLSARTPSR